MSIESKPARFYHAKRHGKRTGVDGLRRLLGIGYAPSMLLGYNGAALAVVAADAPRILLLALVLAAIATSFVLERIIPYEPSWNHGGGDGGRDTVYAIAYEASVYASVALIPVLTLLSPTIGVWPHSWPLWAQLSLAIVVADFGITMCHYASHRIEWLWRFHAPHHSVKRMYGLNGLIKHPVHQALETAAGTAPLVLAGMPMDIGILLGFAITLQLLLQHSNADMRLGPLRHLLALAPMHRFHHQKWAGIGDVNFGLFTNLWDHLLGTAAYVPTKRFTSDELGIGKQPDYPVGYLAQLVEPFRARERQY